MTAQTLQQLRADIDNAAFIHLAAANKFILRQDKSTYELVEHAQDVLLALNRTYMDRQAIAQEIRDLKTGIMFMNKDTDEES